MSDKLPSPPFSANAPFIPETFEIISNDTLETKAGAYIFAKDSMSSDLEIIHVMDVSLHPQFPAWVTTSEMAGPMRYLCSKEEFDKIVKSTDGPENAMEKFWIQSAGGRDKARNLIRTYYQRVWDANHHFTSYAEGWKTDRGMIYLVFGHPETIESENNLEIWSYTLETGQLQFAFEPKQHPIWGEIFILKRNEQYRPHWEFQVSQWRQGRIFK
jgi:GWxTD domain-containing protein